MREHCADTVTPVFSYAARAECAGVFDHTHPVPFPWQGRGEWSADGGQSEESSEHADLSGVQLFVVGAEEEAAEFGGIAGPGEFDGFIEKLLREPGEFAECLLVDAVKDLAEFGG